MKTKYYVNGSGVYLGATNGEPLSSNEVPYAPGDSRQKWNGSDYDSVSISDLDIEKNNKADIEAQFSSTLKAFALVVLAEINALRTAAGLPERTIQQLKDAVKAKL